MRQQSTVIASILALSIPVALAAGPMSSDSSHHNNRSKMRDCAATENSSKNIFSEIALTEQQRQQMRDLINESYRMPPQANTSDIESMHQLMTSDKFDEAAVRKQVETVVQRNIEHRVEMIKLRNQMYNLLMPEQKAQLEQNYQRCMKDFQEQSVNADS